MGYSAKKDLLNKAVMNDKNEKVGMVEDLIVSKNRSVTAAIVSTGGFVTVAPGQTDSTTQINVNSAEFVKTPSLGLMVITLDNPAGTSEAQTIDLQLKKQ